MKFQKKSFKQLTLSLLCLVMLAFTTSCTKDDEQTTNPTPENLVEKPSELLDLMLNTAVNSTDSVGCLSFKYPVSFSLYDTQFQIADTESIESDLELIEFLNALTETDIVTNNFPITLIKNKDEVVANNNQELTNILSAPQDCDIKPTCTPTDVRGSFLECPLHITEYNNTNNLDGYVIRFGINGLFDDNRLEVSYFEKVTNTGTFEITSLDDGTYTLKIESDWDIINGTWTITNCDSFSDITLTRGQDSMRLQGCGYTPNIQNPLACFEDFTDKEIQDIDLDNQEPYNLTLINKDCLNPDLYTVTYHNTKSDAEQNLNPITTLENFVVSSSDVKVYSRVTVANNSNNFKINEINLGLIANNNCTVASTSGQFWECTTTTIDSYNNDTTTYQNYELTFGFQNDVLGITINNDPINPGTYIIAKKADGTFTLTINIDIPELNGTWDIENCEYSNTNVLTRGMDKLSITGCKN